MEAVAFSTVGPALGAHCEGKRRAPGPSCTRASKGPWSAASQEIPQTRRRKVALSRSLWPPSVTTPSFVEDHYARLRSSRPQWRCGMGHQEDLKALEGSQRAIVSMSPRGRPQGAIPPLRGCQPLLWIMGALPPNPRALGVRRTRGGRWHEGRGAGTPRAVQGPRGDGSVAARRREDAPARRLAGRS